MIKLCWKSIFHRGEQLMSIEKKLEIAVEGLKIFSSMSVWSNWYHVNTDASDYISRPWEKAREALKRIENGL